MKAFLTLISSIGYTIYQGYALSVLWMWFVVATFFSAPVLSVAAAVGLMVIVRLMTYKVNPQDVETAKDDNSLLVAVVHWVVPTSALIVGFIVKQFM